MATFLVRLWHCQYWFNFLEQELSPLPYLHRHFWHKEIVILAIQAFFICHTETNSLLFLTKRTFASALYDEIPAELVTYYTFVGIVGETSRYL